MQSFGKYEGVMGVYVMKTALEDCWKASTTRGAIMVHLRRGECLTVTDPIVGEIIAITLRSRQWRGRALFGIAEYRYDQS